MKEKVLGFYEKDGHTGRWFVPVGVETITFEQDKCVPVVSVEEFNKILEDLECMTVIDKALEKEDYSGKQEEAFEHGWTEAINAIRNQSQVAENSEAKK